MVVYGSKDCSGAAATTVTGADNKDCRPLIAGAYVTVDCGVNAAFANAPVTLAVAALLVVVGAFNKFAF